MYTADHNHFRIILSFYKMNQINHHLPKILPHTNNY